MEHNEHEYCSGSYNKEFEDDIHEVVEVEGESLEKGTDELLIDAVRSYPHLYNSSLKEYKDTNMKENSWIEISKILDMSVSTCQNRWLRLRERFSKEKRLRELETRSGSGATHRPVFPLYHNLLFLDSHIKRRKSYTNVSAAKKQLMDASSTSSLPDRINISRSNISIASNSFKYKPKRLFSVFIVLKSISGFKGIKHESNIQQTKELTETDRRSLLSSSSQCESLNFSGTSGATSISRDSTPSPAPQTLPFNIKMDRSRIKNKSNTYSEHSLAALSDSLQKRVTNAEPSQQRGWNLNDLTPDKSFALLVATELERMSESEKSRRKQAIIEILWKPLG
ncbi:uncharacterized protein LOC143908866 [Temnothorax americanus]|uniref:uncharacterized protein LOC143908866 n=1 Tax=Temnothorax americanus TaxID=1964332 RepID=UPI0040698F51